MKCDIIIPIWNQLDYTKSCIEHILKNTNYPYRLILVDNGSDSETRNYLEGLKKSKIAEIDLIRNEKNLGFVKAINQGLKASNAPYVCILNNDTLPAFGWLTALVEFAEKHPRVGLLNPLCNGHAERKMTVNEYARSVSVSNKNKYMEMNQCQGFAMLIKREVIRRIGYLDERFGIGGFDDTDYSMRAHIAGYQSVCLYSSYVYHREHKSFDKLGDRKDIQSEAEKDYFKKWPRHLRIAMILSRPENTSDKNIENFLNSALFLARKWCWVNLLIFSDKKAKNRVNAIMQKTDFPLHQNIKFNYLDRRLKVFELAARILERSFGSKKRKKYDAVICDERKTIPLLRALCNIQKCSLFSLDFGNLPEKELKKIVNSLRSDTGTKSDMKCDIILPICDQYEFTKKCIESILKNTDSPFRLIVINNGKNPGTKKLLDELERDRSVETTIVTNNRNIGWVKALNKGIELSRAPYMCFQNDDTVVTRGWLRKMINILQSRPNFGMINPTWEGRPAGASIDGFNAALERRGKGRFIETDWCRGFSAVIKRAVIEKIGKVDEIYGLAYFDDVDYSVRAIETGFLALKALDTYVYHHRNVTFFEVLKGEKWNELHEKNKLIYYKRWGKPLKIVIILDKKACRDRAALDRIEETAFYLARKQHHIDIWSPRNLHGKFRHTNIKLKVYNDLLLKVLVPFDLYINRNKKPCKRYNAVFKNTQDASFPAFAKETVNRIKEKTKEAIHVNV
ncbi:MAG: glycosyltransferase family 2 protein [Candidatus Omnitrophota bacterium]